MKKLLLGFLAFVFLPYLIGAQPATQLVKVIVGLNHPDWKYTLGENAIFTIQVLKNGNPIVGTEVAYQYGLEKMEPTKKSVFETSSQNITTINAGTLKEPGFLRLIATVKINGKEYRGLATAGFEPEKLEPVVTLPVDFNEFWDKAKADLSKIPMDAKMTLLPERCTEKVNVYHLNLQNFKEGARLYGILCMPKKEGKYPAILHVPGAGIRPYYGDIKNAELGIITLQIGIHGVPVTMDPGVYTDMIGGWANQYWTYNMDNRDKYYYKRVFMGCVRANDFLTSLPQFDGQNLAVTGGSQGGALAIITAGLDKRVKFLGSFYPAMSDMVGYTKNRAGGWPHIFDKDNSFNLTEAKIKTSAYFDVVNFAKNVSQPGIYTWGFNDETCPPTSMYPAYNVIKAPKELVLFQETGHWTFPEENELITNWLLKKLGK